MGQINYQIGALNDFALNVVENKNITSPIRIEGAAGTGKTASMILRATTTASWSSIRNTYALPGCPEEKERFFVFCSFLTVKVCTPSVVISPRALRF